MEEEAYHEHAEHRTSNTPSNIADMFRCVLWGTSLAVYKFCMVKCPQDYLGLCLGTLLDINKTTAAWLYLYVLKRYSTSHLKSLLTVLLTVRF